jgi:broad specificity phosphatase PhoE
MNVYLVRHGETPSNKQKIHQLPSSHLSRKGEEQALLLGEYFKNKDIDYLFSSDLNRAMETASFIAEATETPLVQTAQLREIRRPSHLFGKSHFSVQTFQYVFSMLLHRNDAGWHYKDAESFVQIYERCTTLVRKLEALSSEYQNIVVVSHAVFLELLSTFICYQENPKLHEYLPIFSPFSQVPNASVTKLSYESRAEIGTCNWQILERDAIEHLKA